MNTPLFTRSLLGIVVVAVGVGFMLDALNIIEFTRIASYAWPMAIIFVGVLSLLSNPRVFIWPSFIVGAGILLLLRETGAVDFNVWRIVWPAAIIAGGLSLIFEKFGDSKVSTTSDQTDLFAAFSGNNSRNASKDYRGGKLTAIMGGIELDLREAHIKDKAVLDIFTAMGGVEIKVPETWNVQAGGLPILGGWENKAKPAKEGAPTLVVRGTAIMGGVEIKN
jgi:hypothetical protein